MEKQNKQVRPWDIFNKNIEKVETEIAEKRLAICKGCPELLPTGNCKKCGCFMSSKTKLPHASCPIGKWDAIEIGYKEEINE
jgi:hypothetical protein